MARLDLTAYQRVGFDLDAMNFSDLLGMRYTYRNPIYVTLATDVGRQDVTISGANLTFGADGALDGGGTVRMFSWAWSNDNWYFTLRDTTLEMRSILDWAHRNASQEAWSTILVGDDTIASTSWDDVIKGYAGADTISAGNGNDVIYGHSPGALTGPAAAEHNYLRGDEGDDTITGAFGFDDINGNAGRDLVLAGAGDDWAVGGKDDDQLYGEAGDDIVYGNLGNDTADGGAGADLIRGGQGDDVLFGGDGNDWIAGDRGSDAIWGGAGADVFHSAMVAGIDRVYDFSIADGDRVGLDRNSTYVVRQDGADTIVDMGDGNQVVLVGIRMQDLPAGWIFVDA